MFVEALIPEPAVEALHVGILVWFARLDEVQLNAVDVRPAVEGTLDKLGVIVQDRGRAKVRRCANEEKAVLPSVRGQRTTGAAKPGKETPPMGKEQGEGVL